MANPYESSDVIAREVTQGSQSLRITSLVLLLLDIALTVLIIAGLLRANQFAPLLADFGTDVPWLTQVMHSPWTIGGIAGLAFLSIVKEFLLKNRRWTLILNAVHLPLLLIVWQLHLEAKWLPFTRLIETLR